jgi:high-affinity K+ transport system ATPase subunit B
MTRGSLPTFSMANEVAEYFSVIPATFTFPVLNASNVMHLQTPELTILSALTSHALVIIALIPAALRNVKYGAVQGRVAERHRSGGPFSDEVTVRKHKDHWDKTLERQTTVR